MYLIFSASQLALRVLGANYTWMNTCDYNKIIHMDVVEMSDCEINEVGSRISLLTNITELYLPHNDIIYVYEHNFADLHRLEVLVLKDNQLQKIELKSFDNLLQLERLDLSINSIETIDGLFEKNTKLSMLNLRLNRLKSIHPDTFKKLRNLGFLFMNDNALHFIDGRLLRNSHSLIMILLSLNTIAEINDDTYKNTKFLHSINLNFNNLKELKPTVFQHNQHLSEIYLTGNQLTTIGRDNLKYFPRLLRFYLDFNQLEELTDALLFENNSQLTTLKLNDNKISFLQDHIFKPLLHLNNINLSGNRLQSISSNLLEWNSMEVHLSNNNITIINENSFRALHEMRVLFLDENKISDIPSQCFGSNAQLRLLKLSQNKLRRIAADVFVNNPHLHEISLDSNELVELPEGLFQENGELRKINLAYNKLITLDDRLFRKLYKLTHLQIQNNQLVRLEYRLLYDNYNLEMFNCSNNQLIEMLDHQYYEKPYLTDVDVSGNPVLRIISYRLYDSFYFTTRYHIWNSVLLTANMKDINTMRRKYMSIPILHVRQYDIVLRIVHCKVKTVTCDLQPITAWLDLSFNQLTTIECVTNMTKLNILNLTHNHLQTLSSSWFAGLIHLKQLDISNNGVRIHLRNFRAARELRILSFSNNTIDWSWSLYEIPWLFPKLQNLSMTNIDVYCPLLDTILYNFTEWKLTVTDYNASLISTDENIAGIPCLNYHYLKYVVLEVSFCVVIIIILVLSIIHIINLHSI